MSEKKTKKRYIEDLSIDEILQVIQDRWYNKSKKKFIVKTDGYDHYWIEETEIES